MAAPKGNEFWKLRSKHGRDKLFKSPALLWEAACEYFEWCQANPWEKTDFKGKNNDKVLIPTARPFTLHGLCRYLDCNTAYLRQFKNQLPEGEQDFSTVITLIEETIYQQQFEGAAVNAFNGNIISRNLGLKDSSEIDHTTKGEKIKPVTIIKKYTGNAPE
jgi:hypothetical protein